eukprot:5471667-Pyramimonas_sp.AAC.1
MDPSKSCIPMEKVPSILKLLEAMMANKGTTLRIRAPGQHATSIEPRNGIPRGTLHMIEEELNIHNIPIVFTRALAEGISVTNAFTFTHWAIAFFSP